MEIQTAIKQITGKTAVAIGYFDGVHLGHAEVIGAAAGAGARLGARPAVFTFDMSAARSGNKGSGNIMTEHDKQARIKALGIDLYLAPAFADIADMSGKVFVEQVLSNQLGAVCLCCGRDFRFGKNRACGTAELGDICRALGIELILTDDVLYGDMPVSSTRIKQALSVGDMPSAAAMLGRPYSVCLPVREDKQVARKLGFPTINQLFPQNLAGLRHGVYYTKAVVDGKPRHAISNIGMRPSVSKTTEYISLETHIIDFSADLYGLDIEVEFIDFVRDEQRFEDIDKLKTAVLNDIKTVLGKINK
jgi:riboflavin kinase/FMN adenylyltransferase